MQMHNALQETADFVTAAKTGRVRLAVTTPFPPRKRLVKHPRKGRLDDAPERVEIDIWYLSQSPQRTQSS